MSGTPTPSRRSVPLLAEVLHRVAGERLELRRQAGPRLLHGELDRLGVCSTPLAMTSPPRYRVSPSRRTVSPSRSRLMTSPPTSSTSGMPAAIRISGPRLGYRPLMLGDDVDDRGDPAAHERLGADPVEVDVVDDCDVARAQPLGEVLGPPVQSNATGDARKGRRLPASGEGKPHRAQSCHPRITRRPNRPWRRQPRRAARERAQRRWRCRRGRRASGSARAPGPLPRAW